MIFKHFPGKQLGIMLTLMGTALCLAPASLAQSIDQVDKNPYQSNEKNPNGELGDFMNPLGLMHRANLERSRNGGEFAEDTRTGLSEAAKSFREAQRQLLEAQMANTEEETTANQEPQ
ncbi:hypothetical protein [Crocosphaera sp.]|uniref:hypothetical protein n=1 Tax=Crocosphaera sp. TaxID=2729996 RepID=UPI003F28FD00|nr:hypothetical protein [Crocosphaera sp.]